MICAPKFSDANIDFRFRTTMSSNQKILSIQGKSLKLDTRADIEPWLKDINPSIIEEIHFGGNTIGVEAAQALAEFLSKATSIKVRPPILKSTSQIID